MNAIHCLLLECIQQLQQQNSTSGTHRVASVAAATTDWPSMMRRNSVAHALTTCNRVSLCSSSASSTRDTQSVSAGGPYSYCRPTYQQEYWQQHQWHLGSHQQTWQDALSTSKSYARLDHGSARGTCWPSRHQPPCADRASSPIVRSTCESLLWSVQRYHHHHYQADRERERESAHASSRPHTSSCDALPEANSNCALINCSVSSVSLPVLLNCSIQWRTRAASSSAR
jgi:hypothetical protein